MGTAKKRSLRVHLPAQLSAIKLTAMSSDGASSSGWKLRSFQMAGSLKAVTTVRS